MAGTSSSALPTIGCPKKQKDRDHLGGSSTARALGVQGVHRLGLCQTPRTHFLWHSYRALQRPPRDNILRACDGSIHGTRLEGT